MSTVETIPQAVEQWPEPPQLLVKWSSPWEEFKSAIRPALKRPPKRLAGEAPVGMFPYRGMVISWVLECLLLVAVIVLPARIASLRPYEPPPMPKWDVLYYSGDELPQTQDQGGAPAGRTGRAGGQEARHRTQTIRVVRGTKPTEKVVDAPKLNLPRSDSLVTNLLAFKPLPGPPPAEGMRSRLMIPELPAPAVVAPAPEVNAPQSRNTDRLAANVIAPAPEVSHASTRATPALSTPVVGPAPSLAKDALRSTAPVNPSVVTPPPDTQRDLASSRAQVTQSVNVVAPPVSAPERDSSAVARLRLSAPAVVAPPPSQVNRDFNSWGGSASGNIRTTPVPPPPSMGGGSAAPRAGGEGLSTRVVPPPVSAEGGSLQGAGGKRGGTLSETAQVVPPPPSLGGGQALSGSGRGSRGSGTGGPLDLGTAVSPPKSGGGSAAGSGVVVSNQPGTKVGVPNASSGAIAMSPAGTAKTGVGGSGGGAGIGKGSGPGSGLHGEGPGAGREGAGPGSDPSARSGISPYPGSGGAGRGTNGAPAVPGVLVQGGSTITLPSFGGPGGDTASGPGRSSAGGRKRSGITIVATSRSGGVFNYYGLLKGDNVYSIYIETSLGTAVMEYSDPASATRPMREALSEPEPLRKELPYGLRPTRVVIACVLDRNGVLKDLRLLEPGAAETTSKILAALPSWKFQPAFRGTEPVEVTAIIGFGIDTR